MRFSLSEPDLAKPAAVSTLRRTARAAVLPVIALGRVTPNKTSPLLSTRSLTSSSRVRVLR